MTKPPLGLYQRIRSAGQRNAAVVRDILEKAPPSDVAWCLDRFPVEERLRLLSLLPPKAAAKIFQEAPLNHQTDLLKLGRLPAVVQIVQELDSDEMADVLGTLDAMEKDRWLAALPTQESAEARSLLAYPPDTAGGLMAVEFVKVPLNLNAGEVASRLQSLASQYEHLKVTYVYVVDDVGVLKGVLPLRDLIFRPRETPIADMMVKDVVTMPVTATKQEVAELFRLQNLLALPVVTEEGKLAGVITADDVLDVTRELADEELLKISGVSLEESREDPLRITIRRRFSWLAANIVLNLLAASVIAFYEDTLAQVIALAFFLPIISDMSGNSGMQAVAVSIRDLALNKILPADFMRVLRKEVMIGFANGLAVGIIIGLVAWALKGIPMLGAVVALALWINTIIAATVGGGLPLLLKRFQWDPAIGSGPILTTITDLMGFFLLLSLATFWLPLLLPH